MNALAAALALGLGTDSVVVGVLSWGVLVAAPRLGRWVGDAWWGPVTLAVMVAAGVGVSQGGPVEFALLGVLGWLLLHRRLVSRGSDRIGALVTALILVATATLTTGGVFAVAALAWVFGLPGALGVSRGREAAGLGVAVAAIALPTFWMLPRWGGVDAPTPSADRLTGFSDAVELGSMDSLLDDPAVVFRAQFSRDPVDPPYWRGVALDQFDGRRWTAESPRQREVDWTEPRADLVRVTVELEAHPEGVLFVPGVVEGIDARGMAVERDAAGAYHLPGPARAIEYTVFTRPPWGPGRGDPFIDADPQLGLPHLSDEVESLFSGLVVGAETPDAQMAAIANWLLEDFAYTRQPRDSDAEDPLERFLLERREGHCEYFASALAVGGRVVGVPTRVVNGFVGGEVGPDGSLVVRRYHAHSWVEYFDGGRWVTLDPTPAIQAPEGPGPLQTVQENLSNLWDRLVVDYDRGTQADVASELATAVVPFVSERRRAAVGAVVLGVLAGVVMMLVRVAVRRWMRRVSARPLPADGVSRMLERAVRAVERAGVVVPPGPPVEAARALCTDHPAVAEPLEQLAWLSYEVRFGGVAARENLPRAKELLAAVRAGLQGAS